MLNELLNIQKQIEKATVLVDGMRFAVTERVLNRDSDSNESGTALFSIEISINETKKPCNEGLDLTTKKQAKSLNSA